VLLQRIRQEGGKGRERKEDQVTGKSAKKNSVDVKTRPKRNLKRGSLGEKVQGEKKKFVRRGNRGKGLVMRRKKGKMKFIPTGGGFETPTNSPRGGETGKEHPRWTMEGDGGEKEAINEALRV